jgi:hypothetical protein
MRRLTICILIALATPLDATAQARWTDRVRLAASGGVQWTRPLSESLAPDKYVEPALITAEADQTLLPLVDAGVIVRLTGNIGAGASVSYVTGARDGRVDAELPHPFYFNRPRAVSGSLSDVQHAELALNAGGVYMIVLRRLDIALSGGATFFRVEQDLVRDVTVNEIFPYDTATLAAAQMSRVTESVVGYHAGADVTWKLSSRWGVGMLARFSRARVPFIVDGLDAGRATVGGPQVAAGLRLSEPFRRR